MVLAIPLWNMPKPLFHWIFGGLHLEWFPTYSAEFLNQTLSPPCLPCRPLWSNLLNQRGSGLYFYNLLIKCKILNFIPDWQWRWPKPSWPRTTAWLEWIPTVEFVSDTVYTKHQLVQMERGKNALSFPGFEKCWSFNQASANSQNYMQDAKAGCLLIKRKSWWAGPMCA